MSKRKGSFNPNGMRHMVRCALLQLFAQGSYGTTEEVAEMVEAEGYHANTLAVQVSQLRKILLDDLGIKVKNQRGGRMTLENIQDIERQLGHKKVQAKVKTRLRDAEAVYESKPKSKPKSKETTKPEAAPVAA